MKNVHYGNLDGLRALSCIAIMAMHIDANSAFYINNNISIIISSWDTLVYLFLMISGFGMFCGYYEKIKTSSVDLRIFYNKRISKIAPFFVFLIILDLINDFNLSSLYQAIIESTLLFGLLPNNNLNVIGVGWTIGVIFLFYMLFPFIVYLLYEKKYVKYWIIISIIINFLCNIYFFSSEFVLENFPMRHSFLFCMMFFLVGGAIYIYIKEINYYIEKYRFIYLIVSLIVILLFYIIPNTVYNVDIIALKSLIVFSIVLSYAISINNSLLNNKIMKYLGDISLEIYLCHMLIFRIVEKLNLLYLGGNNELSYVFICCIVFVGVLVFINVYKILYKYLFIKIWNKFYHMEIH